MINYGTIAERGVGVIDLDQEAIENLTDGNLNNGAVVQEFIDYNYATGRPEYNMVVVNYPDVNDGASVKLGREGKKLFKELTKNKYALPTAEGTIYLEMEGDLEKFADTAAYKRYQLAYTKEKGSTRTDAGILSINYINGMAGEVFIDEWDNERVAVEVPASKAFDARGKYAIIRKGKPGEYTYYRPELRSSGELEKMTPAEFRKIAKQGGEIIQMDNEGKLKSVIYPERIWSESKVEQIVDSEYSRIYRAGEYFGAPKKTAEETEQPVSPEKAEERKKVNDQIDQKEKRIDDINNDLNDLRKKLDALRKAKAKAQTRGLRSMSTNPHQSSFVSWSSMIINGLPAVS